MFKNNNLTIVITIVKEKIVKKFKFVLTQEKYDEILEDLETNKLYVKIGPLVLQKESILFVEEIK